MKRNPITHVELEWENSMVSLGNEKSSLIREMTGNDDFFLSLIVSCLYERPRPSVTSDSVFIEWSNPGSPCCQVHCLSLCSLPIWLSTALQVVRTTSPHCHEYNTFWPDLSFSEPWLWTTLNEFTTKSVEDCNDIHNLSWVPTAATDDVFPIGFPVLKALAKLETVGVYTLSYTTLPCHSSEWIDATFVLWFYD